MMVQGNLRRRRRADDNSELEHFLSPVSIALRWVQKRYTLCFVLIFLIYASSGFTTIESNQVGLILRNGMLVGKSTGDAVHGPGVLLALPRPFDQVLRIETSQINTLHIDELRQSSDENGTDGFLLTADRNILHSSIRVRYTIDDPVAYTFYSSNQEEMLRSSVLAAAVQETGAVRLDNLLGQGRGHFLNATLENAQLRADAMRTGLQIVSIEFADLAPPLAVAQAFDTVQSANIAALTQIEESRTYAANKLPAARAKGDSLRAEASAFVETTVRRAKGAVAAFSDLAKAYHKNPSVLVERLYREEIERTFSNAAEVIFVPAPEGPQRGIVHVRISDNAVALPMEADDD